MAFNETFFVSLICFFVAVPGSSTQSAATPNGPIAAVQGTVKGAQAGSTSAATVPTAAIMMTMMAVVATAMTIVV